MVIMTITWAAADVVAVVAFLSEEKQEKKSFIGQTLDRAEPSRATNIRATDEPQKHTNCVKIQNILVRIYVNLNIVFIKIGR